MTEYVDTKEAARRLRCSVATIYRLRQLLVVKRRPSRGSLKVGGKSRLLIDAASLDAILRDDQKAKKPSGQDKQRLVMTLAKYRVAG